MAYVLGRKLADGQWQESEPDGPPMDLANPPHPGQSPTQSTYAFLREFEQRHAGEGWTHWSRAGFDHEGKPERDWQPLSSLV